MIRTIGAAVLILAGMTPATAGATPVTPAAVPGWPVIAPDSGSAFVAGDGTVLSSVPVDTGGSDHGLTEGFSSHGVTMWRVPYRAVCGNCDGPAVPSLGPTGVLGPIGWFGDGLWALDLAGQDVTPCPGAIGPDGDCYGLKLNANPGGPVAVTRVGVWSFSDDSMPRLYDDEIEQPTMAFDATTVYVQVPGGAGSQLLALDRASGRLRWRMTFTARLLGPQRARDGTIVVATRGSGASATTVLGLAPTGAQRWRASLAGPAVTLLANPWGPGAYLARQHSVVLAGSGRAPLFTTSGFVRALVPSPDGTLVVAARAQAAQPLAIVSGLDRAGHVRWRFRQPIASYGGDVATPAVTGDGTVLMPVGDLLFRLDPRRAAPAAPAAPRLLVRSRRIRFEGPEQLCVGGKRTTCTPGTAHGTVAELRLPRGTPHVRVTMTLHATSDPLTNVWEARFLAGAGTSWVAVNQPIGDCPDCGAAPVAVAPGAYVLTAAWSARGRTHRLRTTITVVS